MTSATRDGGTRPDVTVVVVSYNTRDLTIGAVDSALVQSAELAIEVVVVDNASSDGTVEAVQGRFPSVSVVRNASNRGFAVAANQGAACGTGRYILLLNPDAVVLDRAIARLIEWADAHPSHGLYGGRTLGSDGRLDPRSCFAAPTLWSTFCTATGLSGLARNSPLLAPDTMGGWARDTVREVGVITGCFLLVKREVWDELGGMDESYFLFDEDTDLSVRARQRGHRPVHVPHATIAHVYGASTTVRSQRLVLLHTARATFMRKHWSGTKQRVGLGLLQLGVAIRAGVARSPLRRAQRLAPYAEVWDRHREWTQGYPPAGGCPD